MLHTRCLARIEVKGGGVFAPGGVGAALYQAVGKIGVVGRESSKCLPDDFGMFDGQLTGAQQCFQNHDDVILADW